MDGQTNERTNERTKVPCVLQDIVPFGAAAQKDNALCGIIGHMPLRGRCPITSILKY